MNAEPWSELRLRLPEQTIALPRRREALWNLRAQGASVIHDGDSLIVQDANGGDVVVDFAGAARLHEQPRNPCSPTPQLTFSMLSA